MVKSKRADHLVTDLEHTFAKLQVIGIKLNPEKYVFGVPRGMLLGFIISEHGYHKDGPDSEHKGGTTGYGVPHHA